MFTTTAFSDRATTCLAFLPRRSLAALTLGALGVLGGCAVSSPHPVEVVYPSPVYSTPSYPTASYPAPAYSAPSYPAPVAASVYYEPYPVYLPPPGYYVPPVVVVPLVVGPIVRAPVIVQAHFNHPAPRPVVVAAPPVIVAPRIQAPQHGGFHQVPPMQVIAARTGTSAGQGFQHSAGQAFGRDHIAAGQQAASHFRAQPHVQLAHHSGPHASSQPSGSKSSSSRRR